MTEVSKRQTKPLKVGRMYRIECVKTIPWSDKSRKLWLPLFGTIHADDEDTGAIKEIVDNLHLHLDMRFLETEELQLMNLDTRTQGAVTVGPKFGFHKDILKDRKVRVTTRWETRKCIRQWDNVVPYNSEGRQRFEAKYKDHQINLDVPVCPHQGLDLSTVESKDDTIICPGHCLVWSKKTGRLVPHHK